MQVRPFNVLKNDKELLQMPLLLTLSGFVFLTAMTRNSPWVPEDLCSSWDKASKLLELPNSNSNLCTQKMAGRQVWIGNIWRSVMVQGKQFKEKQISKTYSPWRHRKIMQNTINDYSDTNLQTILQDTVFTWATCTASLCFLSHYCYPVPITEVNVLTLFMPTNKSHVVPLWWSAL